MSLTNEVPAAEIAHVLFTDIVGYSLQTFEEQSRLIETLTAIVRGTPEFTRAQSEDDLIKVSAGDGMALVFFRYPLSPVRCALEIARACTFYPGLQLRMGIHSGPVSRTTDISGKPNVSGSGINVAQRVMDCGDAGHILLSSSSAEVLQQFESWRGAITDLGDTTVKHGERLRIYNLCLDSVGNVAVPVRLRKQEISTSAAPSAVEAAQATGNMRVQPTNGSAPLRTIAPRPMSTRTVALLYKRHAPHSAHLTQLLEHALLEEGYRVFIDRHLSVGVEWARELKTQVRNAWAVIPLLSAESIWSEMLEDEIITAYEASQTQDGHPRILPVRVSYDGPLPEPLAAILNPLQYTSWAGPQDDERLVSALSDALRSKPRLTAPTALEPVGGAVPLDSGFYITRPTDREFANALARRDSIVLVKGARQMGKTSLLTRGLQAARESGSQVFRTDFQKMTTANLQSEDTFFRTLAAMIADQLDLDTLPDEKWNPDRSGAFNFERYLRREILAKAATPIVWALDEVDKLFTCPFGSDVFALFRSWHNDRSYEPDGPWSWLTMAIAYATEAHLFITDVNQSPFNVGTRLTLDDFTVVQTDELNRRYGGPLQFPSEVEAFHALVGGQPYLTRRGLDQMTQQGLSLSALKAQADRDEGVFGDHLRRLLVSLSQDGETLAIVRNILMGGPMPAAAVFYRLRSGGLLVGESESDFRLRCGLYGTYLSRHLAPS